MLLVPEDKIRKYTDGGYWGTETITDLIAARAKAKPDDEALVDPENKEALVRLTPQRYTYAAMQTAIDRLACRLVSLGMETDGVILVQLPNIAELVISLFAAARAGVVVSPVPVQWRSHEIRHAVAMTGARVMITSHSFAGFNHVAMVRQALDEEYRLDHIITVGSGPCDGALNMSEILADADTPDTESLVSRKMSANDVFTLCWTSGTEAASKAVPRSHNQWLAISRMVVESFLPDEECTYLSLFPAINMAGLGAVLVPWCITGGKMVLHHPFDLGVFLKQLVVEGVYYTLAPPALLDNLAKSPDWGKMNKGNLKVIGSGSAPLSEWMVSTFQNEFGIGIVNFFASNEGVALYSSPKDFSDPATRASYFPRFGTPNLTWHSQAARGIRSQLVDPATGMEITENDVVGELCFDGPTVFCGYYKAPELTAKAFDKEGLFRSGDLFSITGDNQDKYLFHGRLKDLIIRGGMNISPEEIETLVVGHPKVAEVAAVGYPDERLGERICIVVVPVPGQSIALEEINQYLKARDIAKYKYPEVLKVVDSLPRNPLGKLLKRELRQTVAP
ncbi:MAG: acyl--CoA ligase [Desulfatibacillum sp.]|nr:acyl--CoA ligase [Desulfatibacillum sp.]